MQIFLATFMFFSPFADRSGEPVDSIAWSADQLYIAVFTLGPSWDHAKQAHEQAGFAEHSKNLARLRKEKRALIGARYGTKGMVVFGASSAEEAKAQFADDPMVLGKLFVLELEAFRPFYDGYIPTMSTPARRQ